MSSLPSSPSRSADVSTLLDAANQLFRQALPKCLALAMAAVLVAESATLYWLGTGHKLHGRPPTDPSAWAAATSPTGPPPAR